MTELNSKTLKQIELTLWQNRPEAYFEDCLRINHKITGITVPFALNRGQREVQKAINAQRAAGTPVRILVLKYRQGGYSTLSQANIFHACRFNRGSYMTVSLDVDSAEHIYGISQRFYHYLPDSEKGSVKAVASSRKELKFDEPHGGKMLVETAGKTAAGHSFTLYGLHLSEVSRWPAGTEDARAGLLNSVPDSPNTIIIIESVANGMSGFFWKEWNRPDSAYAKIFVPWFWQEEYTMQLPMPERDYLSTLSELEQDLIARHNLTLEQIEWRRHTIHNKLDDDAEKFKEQYPSTAQEAFITSGNTFFNIPFLDRIETIEPLRCNLEIYERPSKEKEIRPIPNPKGYVRLWRRPQPGKDYVIGADVASGIEIEDAPAGDKYDYSSADVIDRSTGEQVAHWHGQVTPDEFGKQLALLGEYYNYAFQAVEQNAGYGQHVLTVLQNSGYPGSQIYRQQQLDATTKRMTNKLGWTTTKANRRPLMANLDMAARQGEVIINSSEHLQEMRSFIIKPDGRIEAALGHKDDRVFSLALANMALPVANTHQSFLTNEDATLGAITYAPSRSIYRRPSRVA